MLIGSFKLFFQPENSVAHLFELFALGVVVSLGVVGDVACLGGVGEGGDAFVDEDV